MKKCISVTHPVVIEIFKHTRNVSRLIEEATLHYVATKDSKETIANFTDDGLYNKLHIKKD